MLPYVQLISHILEMGNHRGDRTGTGTISSFGQQMNFNLRESFPLLTLKNTNFTLMTDELIWFLRGQTNVNDLLLMKGQTTSIWHPWADKDGWCGPIYGQQWRHWNTPKGQVDQIQQLIDGIRTNPFSRRHIVSAWNVADLPNEKLTPVQNVEKGLMSIAPCHTLFQIYVRELTNAQRAKMLNENPEKFGFKINIEQSDDDYLKGEKLSEILTLMGLPKLEISCKLYQRSADMFLGVPFNIASYALFTHLLVNELNSKRKTESAHSYSVGDLIITFGDAHIYKNHLKQVQEMLKRYDEVYNFKVSELQHHHDSNVKLDLPAKYNLSAIMRGTPNITASDIACFLKGYQPMGFLAGEPAV